jgi:uncharacterized protein YdeI (YjbR/CyaY-like superfamily)
MNIANTAPRRGFETLFEVEGSHKPNLLVFDACMNKSVMKVKVLWSAREFRTWLENNHDQAQALWVGFYNQRARKKSITYREAVDEALCFGWIDGVRQSVTETTYTVRFTPRKPRSYWSAVNLRRFAELTQLGRVVPPGLTAFEKRSKESGRYSFENRPRKLEIAYEEQFRANAKAWEFFRAQAPWYQRTASFWVASAKKEETRIKRLGTLIADSERGRRIEQLTPKSKK